jgi:hypothetical protein
MKAIIMEIYKNFCIVMTEDGKFLKYKMPAGFAEIGDEVIIEKAPAPQPERNWVRGTSIAFAVVVVVIGAVFSYRYLKQNTMTLSAPAVAAARTEEAKDESVNESMKMGVQSEAAEEVPLLEKTFLLEKENVLVEQSLGNLNLLFSYKVLSGEIKNLSIKIKNNNTGAFSGTFNLEMFLGDGVTSRQVAIELMDFNPGSSKEEIVKLEQGETGFKLKVYGNFK